MTVAILEPTIVQSKRLWHISFILLQMLVPRRLFSVMLRPGSSLHWCWLLLMKKELAVVLRRIRLSQLRQTNGSCLWCRICVGIVIWWRLLLLLLHNVRIVIIIQCSIMTELSLLVRVILNLLLLIPQFFSVTCLKEVINYVTVTAPYDMSASNNYPSP